MTKRISGMSFDAYIDGELIHKKNFADITDRTAPPPRPVVRRTAMLMAMWPQKEIEVSSVRFRYRLAKARAVQVRMRY